jgi:hypothetical protein
MTKKIVIIEDSYDDYHALIGILQAYDVSYFPSEDGFLDFANLLNDYAHFHEEDTCKEIISQITAEKPDYILLDIGLNFNEEFDVSGKELEKKMLTAGIGQQIIYYLTNKLPENSTRYIAKRGGVGLEMSLYKVFIERCKINLKQAGIDPGVQVTHANDQGTSEAETLTDQLLKKEPAENTILPPSTVDAKKQKQKKPPVNPLLRATSEPRILKVIRRLASYKLTPILIYATDLIITYCFYLLIISLAFVGSRHLWNVIKTENDFLNIAETTFIVYLPFLVISGFFIFYIQSLRPYLQGNTIIVDRDFDKASKLMMLTKKLFISSLISYLFTKLIGLLFLEKPATEAATQPANPHSPPPPSVEKSASEIFQAYHGIHLPLIQVYVTAGAIFLLIGYYIYLNSHSTTIKDKDEHTS